MPSGLIQRLGWSGCVESVVQIPPGFSGAGVFRVRVQGLGEFAVKRLPAGTDRRRRMQIHLAIDQIRRGGVDSLPAFEHLDQNHGELWEIASWQPGKPLNADADIDRIAAGAKAIGVFHRVSKELHCGTPHQVPRSVHERIDRLTSITTDLLSPNAVSERYLSSYSVTDASIQNCFREAVFDAIVTLQQGWPMVAKGLRQRLAHQSRQPVGCCFVLRDIHRENALFDAGRVGLIDFDAARVDTPALDLARWIGSFATASRKNMDVVIAESLAAYDLENPSGGSSRQSWIDLIDLLRQTGTWGALANWVDWLHQGRQFDPGIEAVARRIRFVANAAKASLSES